jgi:hypothetical protein
MIIQFRSNTIVLLGDTHSYSSTLDTVKNIKSGSDIVFLGDGGEGFGIPENDFVFLSKINDICKQRNIRLFCIRGNHSNPDVWKRNYNFTNLFLVPDYTEAIFPNGKTALLVGGGISIDRFYRKENVDYWKDEITPSIKQNKNFDILFSHDAPNYFNHSTESLQWSPYAQLLNDDKKLFSDALKQRETIGQIVEDIQCKYIFSGHFHNSTWSIDKGKKPCIVYQCLNIDEIVELNVEKI